MLEILTVGKPEKKVESGQRNFLTPGTFEFIVPSRNHHLKGFGYCCWRWGGEE